MEKEQRKIVFPQELAYIVGLVVNSLAVVLIIHADLGISTMSSISLIISKIFPQITYGTWNFLFQAFLLLILIFATKKKLISAVFSLVMARFFGLLLDGWNFLLGSSLNSTHLGVRIGFFLLGFCILVVGASLFLDVDYPILPFDCFVKDISTYYQIPFSKVKTVTDCLFVSITLIISWLVFHKILAIGVGSLFSALFMGRSMGTFDQKVWKKYFTFPRKFTKISA